MTIPHEPSGFWKDVGSALSKIVEVFTKPLAAVSNSIAERLELRFRRKPKLHVHFHPATGIWCLAHQGEKKIMQAGFGADFTHDDPKQTIILVDAFPESARSELSFRDYIDIPPEELVTPDYQVWMMATPVVGQEGENWSGRIIFVDQWKRKYKSEDTFEFKWVGGTNSTVASPSTQSSAKPQTQTLKRKKMKKPSTPPRTSARLATTLSTIAILLSALSWWLNYVTSLPAISPKVEMVERIAPGQQIHVKILLENTGKTTAKHIHPAIAFRFSRAEVPFEATYDGLATPPSWKPTVSDLVSGTHSTLYSMNLLSLAHEHDVEAVLSGQWRLYVYGKVDYKDILHVSHQVHFCGFYQELPGADPLKFSYCESYNETD